MEHKSCSTHCCIIHGCKYGYKDCPVVLGEVIGIEGPHCESCLDMYNEYDDFRAVFEDGSSFQHESLWTMIDAIHSYRNTDNPIVEIEGTIERTVFKRR